MVPAGRLFVNEYNATDRNLYNASQIAYHEGIPGHHLQFSATYEFTHVPDFRKYGEYRLLSKVGRFMPSN